METQGNPGAPGCLGHYRAQDLRYLEGRSRDPDPGEGLATGEALRAPPAALGAAWAARSRPLRNFLNSFREEAECGVRLKGVAGAGRC